MDRTPDQVNQPPADKRTPDQIRDDIHRRRADLVLTLNQLQEQVNRPVRQAKQTVQSPTFRIGAMVAAAGVAALITLNIVSAVRERQRRARLQRLTLGLLGQKSSDPKEDVTRRLEDRLADMERAFYERARRYQAETREPPRSVWSDIAKVAVPAILTQGTALLRDYLLSQEDGSSRSGNGRGDGRRSEGRRGGIPIRFNIGLDR